MPSETWFAKSFRVVRKRLSQSWRYKRLSKRQYLRAHKADQEDLVAEANAARRAGRYTFHGIPLRRPK